MSSPARQIIRRLGKRRKAPSVGTPPGHRFAAKELRKHLKKK